MRLIGWKQLEEKAGHKRTKLWELSKSDPGFPKGVVDGKKTLFVEAEVDAWLMARVARLREESAKPPTPPNPRPRKVRAVLTAPALTR